MKRRVPTVAAVMGVLLAGGTVGGAGAEPARGAHPRPPVVLIGFDEFPIDAARAPGGSIDAARFPNLARFARDATWWPSATAVHDSTPKAFPPILDGRYPRTDERATAAGHPASVFTLFGGRGYEVFSGEEATDICPPRYCPGAAQKRLGIIANLAENGREERLEDWMRAIRRRARPAFYFKHLLLPHGPWIYLPSGRHIDPAIGSLFSPDGFHDRGLTVHNEQRMILQLGYVDRQLGRLIRRMKRHGIYDRSLIALTADHGIAFDVGVSDRRQVSARNVDEVAPVPFFVKAPGQRRGRVNGAHVATVDLVPTVADVLGLAPGWEVEGVSGFSPEARARRRMRIARREFDGFIRLGLGELERRRRLVIARRARVFGTGASSMRRYGDPFASLYRSGPKGWLMGLRASGLPRRHPHVTAAFAEPERWRGVRPQAKAVPVQVAGWVFGGAPGTTREVVAVVNGRIRATGHTFHLRGSDTRETFSMVVPERSLRRGRNHVELLEVVQSRGRLALRALTGNGAAPVPSEACLRPASTTLRRSFGWSTWAWCPIAMP
jgi:hypothetical protein